MVPTMSEITIDEDEWMSDHDGSVDDNDPYVRPGRPDWMPSTETLITIALVAFATIFVVWNLRPGDWFKDTTPTGGDMGAHVWSPAYLRDVLLPDFRLTGWSPDWYAGFPAFTFYMIVPSLLIVIVNVGLGGGVLVPVAAAGGLAVGAARAHNRWGTSVERTAAIYGVGMFLWLLVVPVPYGIAMKLVVVAGTVLLPVAAYSAGRLGGLKFPGPALMAVMMLPFLFDRSYNIYGGNLMSTMAGEFAYSLGLMFAVLYVGVAARGMATGRHRGLAAALLALAGLTHLFAAFFGLIVTLALYITRPGRRETRWLMVVGPLSGLLAAFWVLPFFWNRALLNDMGWGKERRYVAALWNRSGSFGDQTFLQNDPPMQLLVVIAIVGAVLCGLRRVRLGMALSLVAVFFAGTFLLLPEGRLWNVRILPFYYLAINIMVAIAIAEFGRLLVEIVRPIRGHTRSTWLAAGPAVATAMVLFVSLGLPLRSLPGGSLNPSGEYTWLGFKESDLNLGPSWLKHNFRGYEGQAAYPEYSQMIATMDRVGKTHGCGRALWEYEADRLGSYGTPMSPMLLPHWTDGCIGSMEGLYFEASATTPYHFLLQSELSAAPSRAQRDLPYSGLDASSGVAHLQDLGVRYYLAFSDAAVRQAQAEPRLTEIATSGPWVAFLVEDSDLVIGLDQLPVVIDGIRAGGEEWLVPSVAWWEASNVALIAADGPQTWPQTSMAEIAEAAPDFAATIDGEDRVAEMRSLSAVLGDVLENKAVDPVQVSEVVTDESSITFSVSDIGRPVLVRTSYFPNWSAHGADGPYRVAPNLMVVVPTQTEVSLTYGRSGIEVFSMLLSLMGLVGLVFVARRKSSDPDQAPWDFGTVSSPSNAAATASNALVGLAGSSLLVGGTLIAAVVVSPGADEFLPSLVVWLPGTVGLVAALFSFLPTLIERRTALVEPPTDLERDERPVDEPPVDEAAVDESG